MESSGWLCISELCSEWRGWHYALSRTACHTAQVIQTMQKDLQVQFFRYAIWNDIRLVFTGCLIDNLLDTWILEISQKWPEQLAIEHKCWHNCTPYPQKPIICSWNCLSTLIRTRGLKFIWFLRFKVLIAVLAAILNFLKSKKYINRYAATI